MTVSKKSRQSFLLSVFVFENSIRILTIVIIVLRIVIVVSVLIVILRILVLRILAVSVLVVIHFTHPAFIIIFSKKAGNIHLAII